MQDQTPRDQTADDSGSIRQPPPINKRVFVSYSREDKTFVLRLANALKARSIPVWLDLWDIPPGADWNQSIDRALGESDKVVIVLSPAAVASIQVQAEINTAVNAREKAVFPVLYKDCDVPRILRLYNFSDFREPGNFEPELSRLADALGAKAPPPPPPPIAAFWRRFATKFGRLMQRPRLLLAATMGAAVISAILIVLAPRDDEPPPSPPPRANGKPSGECQRR